PCLGCPTRTSAAGGDQLSLPDPDPELQIGLHSCLHLECLVIDLVRERIHDHPASGEPPAQWSRPPQCWIHSALQDALSPRPGERRRRSSGPAPRARLRARGSSRCSRSSAYRPTPSSHVERDENDPEQSCEPHPHRDRSSVKYSLH